MRREAKIWAALGALLLLQACGAGTSTPLTPWGTPERIGDPADPLALAGNDAGVALAAWTTHTSSGRGPGLDQLFANTYTGTWNGAQAISSYDLSPLRPGVDREGNGLLVWFSLSTLWAVRRSPSGAWSATENIVTTLGPADLAVGAEGGAVLAFVQSGAVWASDGSTTGPWSPPVVIGAISDPNDERQFYVAPWTATDGAGNALVAWRSYVPGMASLQVSTRAAGGAWQPAVTLDAADSGSALVAMDMERRAVVVWSNKASGACCAFSRFTPDSGWSTPQSFGDEGLKPVVLATNARGDAVLLLTDTRTLYAAAYSPDTGFGEPVILELPPGRVVGNVSPQLREFSGAPAALAIDGQGRAVVVWTEKAPDLPLSVWAARFGAGRWSAREIVSRNITTPVDGTTCTAYAPAVTVDGQGAAQALWSQTCADADPFNTGLFASHAEAP